tara:strand:+ start:110 stop:640 length:531 start_codon:yes stop_codon:yes gene_type:complete
MKKVLQDFFLGIQYRKHLKLLGQRKIKHATRIRSVGILLGPDMEIDTQFIYNIATELSVPLRNVHVMSLATKVHEDQKVKTKKFFYNQKLLPWTGRFTVQETHFCETTLDVLINYFEGPNKLLGLISVKSKAKFRIGFAQADHRLNDLVFDFDPSEKNLFVLEMKKYLKTMFKIAS